MHRLLVPTLALLLAPAMALAAAETTTTTVTQSDVTVYDEDGSVDRFHVHRKDDVANFDRNHTQQHRRGFPNAINLGKKLVAVKLVGGIDYTVGKFHNLIFAQIFGIVVVASKDDFSRAEY